MVDENPKSNNPSAIRSRTMIVEALLKLLKKKEFTKITITDIANEAQIVRKTFYHLFIAWRMFWMNILDLFIWNILI